MATAADVCEVCGLEDFTLEDGFYYCTECGTKLLHKREIVDDDINVGAHTRIRTEVAVERTISSWEQMNYILHGLTERLIELGAPEELKATVLQIWCAYLNTAEIAFFHKRQRKRPRLALRNQRWDLKLLFNRDNPKKPKRKVKESDEISTKRRRKKTQEMLKAEQEEALIQSQTSDLESTIDSLSTSMQSSSNSAHIPLSFQFNRRARKRLLEEMHLDKEHVEWHEQEAPVEASCHPFPYLGVKHSCTQDFDNWSKVHRKTILIAILALALNQVRSPIQIADLMRWIDEGHLPFHDLRQFLPEDIDPVCYSETLTHMLAQQGFAYCRKLASLIATDLGIVPIEPDLSALCHRFLGELALPLDLVPYIIKVIAIGPEIRRSYVYSYFPNYEIHVMKYILFVMKLLFGLDGKIENKIDFTTAKLNERMGAFSNWPKLFVWSEWQRYITMRHIILEQVHYPTSHSRTQSKINRPIDKDLFLSFFETRVVADDDNTTGYQAGYHRPSHKPAQERLFKNLHTVLSTATDKHTKPRDKRAKQHMHFDHSMEPQRTYFAEILNMEAAERQNVYIPEYMQTDHSQRTVTPFVNPMPLKKHLLVHRRVRLVTKKVKPKLKQIQMVKYNSHLTNVELYLAANKFAHVLQLEDSSDELNSSDNSNVQSNILDYINSKAEQHQLSSEEMLHKTLCQNAIEEMESNLRTAEFAVVAKDAELSFLKEIAEEVNPFQNNPAVDETLLDEQQCTETIPIALPNYYYWVNNGNLRYISYDVFEQDYFSSFPASFQLLLREAAYVTRCSMLELYSELNELEKYFFKCYGRIK
ncbi:TATA box-binding protein-associated factor RNA polymerase I subunit B [Anopheles maculipalpis]|uniref:TATA box-binding protein-associated factor RNA polymerase I subunit B n=1 Tax=Anopheles maculipalpis TaxID=1496333 RepID=UPI0021593E86|nr:TATA box-binding protein-associated factor RNA polymerase I subunit B [Anopheles maculipalpis]